MYEEDDSSASSSEEEEDEEQLQKILNNLIRENEQLVVSHIQIANHVLVHSYQDVIRFIILAILVVFYTLAKLIFYLVRFIKLDHVWGSGIIESSSYSGNHRV